MERAQNDSTSFRRLLYWEDIVGRVNLVLNDLTQKYVLLLWYKMSYVKKIYWREVDKLASTEFMTRF